MVFRLSSVHHYCEDRRFSPPAFFTPFSGPCLWLHCNRRVDHSRILAATFRKIVFLKEHSRIISYHQPPLSILYHFYIFEIRLSGTTRSTLSDIFEGTTSSAKHPHSSVYAHSARLARHAHHPPLSLLNQDQRNSQTTSPDRIPLWILMEKVQDQRNIHITRHLPKQIHYDHIILSIVIFLTIPAQSLSHTRLLTWE